MSNLRTKTRSSETGDVCQGLIQAGSFQLQESAESAPSENAHCVTQLLVSRSGFHCRSTSARLVYAASNLLCFVFWFLDPLGETRLMRRAEILTLETIHCGYHFILIPAPKRKFGAFADGVFYVAADVEGRAVSAVHQGHTEGLDPPAHRRRPAPGAAHEPEDTQVRRVVGGRGRVGQAVCLSVGC